MIIVMQPDADEAAIAAVEAKIRAHGLDVHVSRGTERTLIGAIGDERSLDPEMFDPMPGVQARGPRVAQGEHGGRRRWRADRRRHRADHRRPVLRRDC